jgi:SAM-dependent methyltransferase
MKVSLIFKKVFRRILKLVFGFDHWHTSVIEERHYALDIVNYCNTRKDRGTILEIGCGLGDMLRRANFHKKIGFDIDLRVLQAAKLLSRLSVGPKIRFDEFRFPESELKEIVDILIMVNWIFFIEQDTLRAYIEKYFQKNLRDGGAIIIDTLKDPHYPNHHDVKILTANLPCKIHKIGNYPRQREVWAIEKAPIIA